MTTFYNSYKPQVLSRTEGFHLPSPAPSTPPSDPAANPSSSSPTSASSSLNPTSPTASSFDTHNLFLNPPTYLNVPETFRKFPSEHGVGASSNMDFSEELASLMVHPQNGQGGGSSNTSHERSTSHPAAHSPASYDDYRSHTHNIFDISAPTTHHSQQPHSSHNHSHSHHGSHHGHSQSYGSSSSYGVTGGGNATSPLHDFSSHTHFNSTVPAIGSSMRYEPPPQSPFNLNPNPPTSAGGEPSSVSSFNSHISSLSSFSNMSNTTTTTTPSSEYHPHHYGAHPQRQTPSPISTELSRSRSRSRSQVGVNGVNGVNGEPPSTNGGPARRTRAKRGSVSSVSPPPLHRATQPLVIPGSQGRGPASPLSLHTNGWGFLGNGNTPGATPGSAPSGNGVANGEFSLPTPESVHGGFTAFNGALPSPIPGLPGSIGLGGLNVGSMPSNGNGVNGVGAKADATTDVASKQAMIANEKRRRRRESHNAVERRRRDNINEKISELATLIPEHLLDPAAPASASSPTAMTTEDLLAPSAGALGGSPGLDDDELGLGAKESGREKSGSVDGKERDSKEGVKDKEGKGKCEDKDKDGKEGGAVKANKGMILRKSVEYIRYLQQLVSAQASRNRDLEQQLQAFKTGGVPLSSDDLSADDTLTILPSASSPSNPASAANANSTAASATAASPSACGNTKRRSKVFNGLESVEEMDTEDDLHNHSHLRREDDEMDQDHDMEGTSPSVGEGDEDDAFDDREEVERGRKGRPSEKVKVKEESGDMETS